MEQNPSRDIFFMRQALAEAHKAKSAVKADLDEQRQDLISRKHRCQTFIQAIKAQTNALTEFDEPLWNLLVESVTVHAGRLVFKLKNGMEIEKVI